MTELFNYQAVASCASCKHWVHVWFGLYDYTGSVFGLVSLIAGLDSIDVRKMLYIMTRASFAVSLYCKLYCCQWKITTYIG